jgi:hypothetical protein
VTLLPANAASANLRREPGTGRRGGCWRG